MLNDIHFVQIHAITLIMGLGRNTGETNQDPFVIEKKEQRAGKCLSLCVLLPFTFFCFPTFGFGEKNLGTMLLGGGSGIC